MARLGLFLLLTPALLGATADVSRFRPAATHDGLFATESTDPLYPLQYSLGGFASYALNPVIWRYADDTYDPVIAHQVMTDLSAAIGVLNYLDFGVVLPVIYQQGPKRNFVGITDDPSATSVNGVRFGDLRLIPRVSLFRERSYRFGLAFTSEVSVQTGDNNRFAGDPGVTWRPKLIGSYPLPKTPVRLTASLGYVVRKNAEPAGLSIGDEVEVHAGSEVQVSEAVKIVGELITSTKASAPFQDAGLSSLEILVGARARVFESFLATIGAGPGLTDGVGTPDFRAFLGLAYAPFPPDRDGDGIPDVSDDCPDVKEDLDRFEDNDGCPEPDNDQDGIPDTLDYCPNDPEDKNGVRDDDGCPDEGVFDADGDGIEDDEDQCPNEREDKDDFEDGDGCPEPDNDRDGILDADDKCPEDKETINGVDDWDGCPDEGEGQTEYIENVKIEIKATILFETSKAAIKEESKSLLDQVALQILAHPEIKKVRIEGHTDSVGPAEDNLYLSQDRADSVRRYLIGRGIAKNRLEAVGYGETRPIDTNDTNAGRTKNRRVDFVILQE